MRLFLLSFIATLLLGAQAFAEPHFPELTGRVVDDAHLLTDETKHSLELTLETYEKTTTNQIVVATVKSLDGTTIEDYGYQLGRYWKVGQKGKDNGALLLIAPTEKKVRIEVGYGLEPLLTDAMCSRIVHSVILPEFKANHMQDGIVNGVQAMLDVLSGKDRPALINSQSQTVDQIQLPPWITMLLLVLFITFVIRHPILAMWILSNNSSRIGSGRMGSDWGGGGFSGGGGSFGGGGASGSW